MRESLEPSPNLTSNARQARVRILPTALVCTWWRHTSRSHLGVDMLEPIHVIEEASRRSSSTTPKGPDEPGHQPRVGGSESLRSCAALRLPEWPSGDPS